MKPSPLLVLLVAVLLSHAPHSSASASKTKLQLRKEAAADAQEARAAEAVAAAVAAAQRRGEIPSPTHRTPAAPGLGEVAATERLNDREFCDSCKALFENAHRQIVQDINAHTRNGGKNAPKADGNKLLHPNFCAGPKVTYTDEADVAPPLARHVRLGCEAILRDPKHRKMYKTTLTDSMDKTSTMQYHSGGVTRVRKHKRKMCVTAIGACAPRDLEPAAGEKSPPSACDLCRRVAGDLLDDVARRDWSRLAEMKDGKAKRRWKAAYIGGAMEKVCAEVAMRHSDSIKATEEECERLMDDHEDDINGAIARLLPGVKVGDAVARARDVEVRWGEWQRGWVGVRGVVVWVAMCGAGGAGGWTIELEWDSSECSGLGNPMCYVYASRLPYASRCNPICPLL